MKIDDSGSNPNNYAIGARAPDFAQAYTITATGPAPLATKTFSVPLSASYKDDPNFQDIAVVITVVSAEVTYIYHRTAATSLGAHFKVDTHANDVRVGPPLVGWWQLCLSRLNGSGNLHSNGKLINGGKLFQHNKCPTHRGGSRTLDASVMWQVLRGKLTKRKVELNFGTHEPVDVMTLKLVAKVISTFDRKLCPIGTSATITLIQDRRQLKNGNSMDFAQVFPAGGKCLGQRQGWSNADNPNNNPPVGGLRGGQHAQVNIDERSANS